MSDLIEVLVTMPNGFRFQTCFSPDMPETLMEKVWSDIRRKAELELILTEGMHD